MDQHYVTVAPGLGAWAWGCSGHRHHQSPEAPGQWQSRQERGSQRLLEKRLLPQSSLPLKSHCAGARQRPPRRGSLPLGYTAPWSGRSDLRVQVTLAGSGVTWTWNPLPHADPSRPRDWFRKSEGAPARLWAEHAPCRAWAGAARPQTAGPGPSPFPLSPSSGLSPNSQLSL